MGAQRATGIDPGPETRTSGNGVGRLALLETAAQEAQHADGWRDAVSVAEAVPTKDLDWMLDADLYDFFVTEARLVDHDRLSSADGGGLW